MSYSFLPIHFFFITSQHWVSPNALHDAARKLKQWRERWRDALYYCQKQDIPSSLCWTASRHHFQKSLWALGNKSHSWQLIQIEALLLPAQHGPSQPARVLCHREGACPAGWHFHPAVTRIKPCWALSWESQGLWAPHYCLGLALTGEDRDSRSLLAP